ncbi:hypothetical protein RJ639_005759 [Escallonia herrerae]|uniref:Uncharacterized protein n=1 Tax=Escallonia herrerae TaxID=1293975 RepID=A0AA89AT66_9ASTE|nr:hypothetical protein RJ639_005759 [Escallonia herrerae]
MDGLHGFYEQDDEVKNDDSIHERIRRLFCNSNFYLNSAPAANLRVSFYGAMAPKPPSPEILPAACRRGFFVCDQAWKTEYLAPVSLGDNVLMTSMDPKRSCFPLLK